MRSKLLACGVLTMIALSALGARCYRITWETPEDEDAFGAAVWRELVLAKGEYRFTPAYAVTERLLGRCGEHPADEELVRRRGGLLCQAYVLDVDTPGGTETLGIVGELLAMFGPIESDEEAASLIRATVGGFATYDGATAVAGDEFLVRVDDLRHNCTPTAAFYKIVYAVRRDGDARIVGEEPARREHQGGGICYD
jgi:hypothetical protein